jgi:hypothetical protein
MSRLMPPPSCIEQEFEQYVLLRELIHFMTPLFVVSTHSACDTNQFFVAVPPDKMVEDFVVPGTTGLEKRLFQAVVRSHIFSGAEEGHLTSFGGHSASVSFAKLSDHEASTAPMGCPYAVLTVSSSSGVSHSATVLRAVRLSTNPSFTFLFTDLSMHHVMPMSRRTVASMRSFGVSGTQPLWQRVPCSAIRPIRARTKELGEKRNDLQDLTPKIPTERLLAYFKSDEQSFRQFVVDFAMEKGEEILMRRMSTAATGLDPQSPHSPVAAQSLSTPSKAGKHDDDAAAVQGVLQKSMDKAMMFIDTEVGIFRSSYLVVKGYEDFAIAKMLQIVDTAVELAIGDEGEQAEDDIDDCDIAVHHPARRNSCESVLNGWSEEDEEQLGVAFHTLVTSGLSTKMIMHWEDINYNEDFAFCHACGVLRRREGRLEDLRSCFPDLIPECCDQIVVLVKLLDDHTLSVFSYMRIMESTIAVAVDLVAQVSSSSVEVTADICIPLIVYLLVVSGPKCLPSRIKYILECCTPVLEMSALGYALTTFEAACVQLLEEYRLHVTMQE